MSDLINLFSINTSSAEPIYRQLVDLVRRHVAAGQMRAGDAMPSVRELAAALAVNPMTVSKAYGLLESEGLLRRIRGMGMEIAQQPESDNHLDARLSLLAQSMEAVARHARELNISLDEAMDLLKQLYER